MMHIHQYQNKWNNLILVLIISIGLGSCSDQKTNDQNQVITVSILPYRYFVQKIAGEHFKIEVMIPPGASPATYEPTPRQVINMSGSRAYLTSGYLSFELNWINKMQQQHPDVAFVNTSRDVSLIINEDNPDHAHGAVEPHIWTSPRNVKIIAQNIAQSLSRLDPDHQSEYMANLSAFHQQIDSVDQRIRELLKDKANRSFIIYHPALTYFSRDYHLNQVSLEHEGKEPSVRHVQEIVEMAKSEHIRAILVQSQFNTAEAKTLEKEINGKIIPIDPLALDWPREIIRIAQELSKNL